MVQLQSHARSIFQYIYSTHRSLPSVVITRRWSGDIEFGRDPDPKKEPKYYAHLLNDNGKVQYLPYDCKLHMTNHEEYNLKKVPEWFDRVGASKPGIPVYVAFIGDSMHRYLFFQLAAALKCKVHRPKYEFAACFGYTDKGTGIALTFHFLGAMFVPRISKYAYLPLSASPQTPKAKMPTLEVPQGVISKEEWLKQTPRFIISYPGHHDHSRNSTNFAEGVELFYELLLNDASRGGAVERIGLSNIPATNAGTCREGLHECWRHASS
jgi:hypothetical protein